MQLKTKLQKYIYWFTFLAINFLSLLFKIRKLNFVEYKYDQQFAFNVVSNCQNGEIFNYIQNSAGVPAGPLIYLYECVGGLVGISNYQSLLIFEILISQLLLIFLFYSLKNYLNPYSNLSVFLAICLNPFLVLWTRNPGITAHFELFAVLFVYYYLNRNKKKSNYFFIGFLSSLSFAAYIPIFVISYSILFTLLLFRKINNLKFLIYGSLSGFLISIMSFIPYYQNAPFEFPRSRSGSWGLSSYWRILIDVLSGRSIKTKINNPEDYELLNQNFSQFDFFVNLNYVLILLILSYALFHLFKNLYKNQINDLDILFIGSLIISGIIFTVLDVPLYAHYLLTLSIFIFIYSFNAIIRNSFLILIFIVLMFSNIYINFSFHEFIQVNSGAENSDYGKSYITCGCCVEDARVCRGQ